MSDSYITLLVQPLLCSDRSTYKCTKALNRENPLECIRQSIRVRFNYRLRESFKMNQRHVSTKPLPLMNILPLLKTKIYIYSRHQRKLSKHQLCQGAASTFFMIAILKRWQFLELSITNNICQILILMDLTTCFKRHLLSINHLKGQCKSNKACIYTKVEGPR